MREVVVSAATLAGLVGLACLYNNGSQRVRREADFEAVSDMEYEVLDLEQNDDNSNMNDMEFIKSLGLLEDSSDMPAFLQEDIEMFQSGGNTRKKIDFILKCIKNYQCSSRADATCRKWSANQRKFMEQNELAAPVVTSVQCADQLVGEEADCCTPNDPYQPCAGSDNLYRPNNRAARQLTGNPEQNVIISENEPKSEALGQIIKFINPPTETIQDAGSPRNILSAGGGSKVVVVIPNGISVGMREDILEGRFENYYGWFLKFNDKYLGVHKQVALPGRDQISLWFIREDKTIKLITKAPVKFNAKFPFRRFKSLCNKPENTAQLPSAKPVLKAIADQIKKKVLRTSDSMSCFVIWFHQYIPSDVTDISSPEFQENVVNVVENTCVVIHIWVGMDTIKDDKNTMQVVNYLQGIYQPSQARATAADPDLRGWYHVKDLKELIEDDNLQAKVYNLMLLEKLHCGCILTTGAKNLLMEIAKATAELKSNDYTQDEYYMFTTSTTLGPQEGTLGSTTAGMDDLTTTQESLSVSVSNTTFWTTTTEPVPEENLACCGPRFKYNIATHSCVNGEVVRNE